MPSKLQKYILDCLFWFPHIHPKMPVDSFKPICQYANMLPLGVGLKMNHGETHSIRPCRPGHHSYVSSGRGLTLTQNIKVNQIFS